MLLPPVALHEGVVNAETETLKGTCITVKTIWFVNVSLQKFSGAWERSREAGEAMGGIVRC